MANSNGDEETTTLSSCACPEVFDRTNFRLFAFFFAFRLFGLETLSNEFESGLGAAPGRPVSAPVGPGSVPEVLEAEAVYQDWVEYLDQKKLWFIRGVHSTVVMVVKAVMEAMVVAVPVVMVG